MKGRFTMVMILVLTVNSFTSIARLRPIPLNRTTSSGYQTLTAEEKIFAAPFPSKKKSNPPKMDSAYLAKWAYHWILYYDFYTTLTGIQTSHSTNPNEQSNLYFYYNIDIKSNLEFRKIKWDMYLFNDYGFRHFFDSLTTKTQDQLVVKQSLYYPIYKRKCYISLAANTKTKLFNTYQYRSSISGSDEKYLYDSYMSPGTIYYSGGITYEAGGNSIIQLGLGSSKVTKIRNQRIFETRNTEQINGLRQGESKKTELGLTLTSTVPIQHLNKHVHWEFYANVFTPMKNLKTVKNYTVDVNHVFHLTFLKYIRLSWRLQINYHPEQQEKPMIQHQVSLGAYLSNHL